MSICFQCGVVGVSRNLAQLRPASLDAVRGGLTLGLTIELGLLLRPAR